MIVGLGIDVVDIARFHLALQRAPGLVQRLFTPVEQSLPLASLAARFAAKQSAGQGARFCASSESDRRNSMTSSA